MTAHCGLAVAIAEWLGCLSRGGGPAPTREKLIDPRGDRYVFLTQPEGPVGQSLIGLGRDETDGLVGLAGDEGRHILSEEEK